MVAQTPITLITGPLGSGKTTLLQQILVQASLQLALVINEFGELGIDGKVVQGKHVTITELSGGCVCCSLLDEFETAVQEILARVKPQAIVVETTGVAEPEALVFDVAETLPALRLDGVIAVMDADAMERFPDLGPTTRMQIEAADLLLLNKIDQVPEDRLERLKDNLRELNRRTPIIPTRFCQVDSNLLFGITRSQPAPKLSHRHQAEFNAFTYQTRSPLRQNHFERLLETLDPAIYRAKGFVRFANGSFLFNYVNGRWRLEPFPAEETTLVFIGRHAATKSAALCEALQACTV
jgi:G3E family GTPase